MNAVQVRYITRNFRCRYLVQTQCYHFFPNTQQEKKHGRLTLPLYFPNFSVCTNFPIYAISQQTRSFARQRLKRSQLQEFTEAQVLEEEASKRSVREIIFGKGHEDPVQFQKNPQDGLWFKHMSIRQKTVFLHGVLKESIRQYLWTWQGFLKPQHKMTDEDFIYRTVEEEKAWKEQQKTNSGDQNGDAQDNKDINVSDLISKAEENVKILQKEAPETIKSLTGITSREELKQWAEEQLKLAIECLSQFMQGYRTGRDEEVEKMLHEYFQDLEDKINEGSLQKIVSNQSDESKKRRRRPIRSLKYNY